MNVVAFGAHPDDLEIGMGGTIARHASAGDRVVMVTATIPNNRDTRRREAELAADVLGAELVVLDIPPEQLLHSRDTVKRFDKVLETVNPDVIYTHWNSDSHQDHNAVSMATIGATRANRCAVLMYEQTIPGGIVPWGFRAQSYVDISAWMPMKMESIATHKSQVRANGDLWVQGVRGRAMYRGYQMNAEFAEAFEVIKAIDVYFKDWKRRPRAAVGGEASGLSSRRSRVQTSLAHDVRPDQAADRPCARLRFRQYREPYGRISPDSRLQPLSHAGGLRRARPRHHARSDPVHLHEHGAELGPVPDLLPRTTSRRSTQDGHHHLALAHPHRCRFPIGLLALVPVEAPRVAPRR